MTCEEFSDQFDTLLNSYNIQAGFGEGANKQGGITLDEYEKSILLTQAQDMIVKAYFETQGAGFDDSIRRQVDFSSLIATRNYHSASNKPGLTEVPLRHVAHVCYDDRGLMVRMGNSQDSILYILNEKLTVKDANGGSKSFVVVPINYKEYDREMSKAYAQPLKKQAWRLFNNTVTGYELASELIPIDGTVTLETTVYYHTCEKQDDGSYKWIATKEEDVNPADIELYIYTPSILDEPSKELEYKVAKVIDTHPKEFVSYRLRYVKRPTPIVLRDLPNGLSVDNVSVKTECVLHPILHMDILNKAYELAVTTRGGGTAQRTSREEQQRQ